MWASPNQGAPIVIFPDLPSFTIPDIVTPSGSEEEEEEEFPGEYFDMHSHNFCAGDADWTAAESWASGTATEERIDRLYSLYAAGVGRMVVSGMLDNTYGGDFVDDVQKANDITEYAYDLYPEFFVPFLQLLPGDIHSLAWMYVQAKLEDGFQGIGELFIHGHGGNINENDALASICGVAAAYGVPVQVHWEFGNVDDPSVRTAASNFYQLLDLLSLFPNVPIAAYRASSVIDTLPLKLILAHCAAGPGDMADGSAAFTAYQGMVELLLAGYPNVYFDVAGMQIGGSNQLYNSATGTLKDLGNFLLEKMASYPTRFVVGIDAENRFDVSTWKETVSRDGVVEGRWYPGIDTYLASVPNYGTFLGKTPTSGIPLTASQQELIKFRNASEILYTKATAWSPPTASSSSASWSYSSWSTPHWP